MIPSFVHLQVCTSIALILAEITGKAEHVREMVGLHMVFERRLPL